MTNAPNISVASRAHRAFRAVGRFRFLSDEDSSSDATFVTNREHGKPIGIYENPDGVDPARVVVTDQALGCVGIDQERWIHFDEIDTTHGPQEKGVDDAITVVMKSGIRTQLKIAGGEGRFKDIFSFVRFIDRVLEDRRNAD